MDNDWRRFNDEVGGTRRFSVTLSRRTAADEPPNSKDTGNESTDRQEHKQPEDGRKAGIRTIFRSATHGKQGETGGDTEPQFARILLLLRSRLPDQRRRVLVELLSVKGQSFGENIAEGLPRKPRTWVVMNFFS